MRSSESTRPAGAARPSAPGERRQAADAPHLLLINPWIHDFAAYDFWARPMGLLSLAATLRRQDWRVSYIDCLDRFHRLAPPTNPRLRHGRGPFFKTPIARPPGMADVPRTWSRYGIRPEWLQADLSALPRPDMVLVTSAMTYWYPGVRETIAVVRKAFPGAPVALGGIYATLLPEHAARHTGADFVVRGHGHRAILDLVSQQLGATAVWRPAEGALDRLPYPALDLLRAVNMAPILTAVGCPFRCAYCAVHRLAPRYRRREPEAVMAEIRYWHERFAVRDFVFYDDALLSGRAEHALPLFEAIVRSGLALNFHTPNALHVKEIDLETAGLMRAAGFRTLRLGLERIESGSGDRHDAKIAKGDFEAAMGCLRGAGFTSREVGAYLLAGLPGQPLESLRPSISAVKRWGATPIPTFYSPIPGTALWEEALASSRYDLDGDPLFCNNAILPCRKTPFDWSEISALKSLCGPE